MDPNFALAHNQLGQAYLQKQMNEDAITELQKAVQLSAGSPTCLANLARLRSIRQEERSGEATERSEEALEPRLFTCLGNCRDLCGSRREEPGDDLTRKRL
jgi:Flp pilus assembly protein TadD